MGHVTNISTTIKEIDNASQGQAEGLRGINHKMSEIDGVIHSTAASAKETSLSANKLTTLSVKLQAQLENIRNIDGLIDILEKNDASLIEVKNIS